jgi:very-short-patch-repair endonuclease
MLLDQNLPTRFAEDPFKEYLRLWNQARNIVPFVFPPIPEILFNWVEIDETSHQPIPRGEIIISEIFEDDPTRAPAFEKYTEESWAQWSKKVLPIYRANALYDELFAMNQRLSVEGERIELLWGHLFLTWDHSPGNLIRHPLVLTPVNLMFDPAQRTISLTPSQTIPPKLDADCLLNLDFPSKDELIKFIRTVNKDEETPPDPWNNNIMRGYASTITGYICREPIEKTNLYSVEPRIPDIIDSYPIIFNAPMIFVRERTRRFWVDDAEKVAKSIESGMGIPPFIQSLVANPNNQDLPNQEECYEVEPEEDEGEYLLPLEYNDQQEEIVKKLKNHFGILVQGPPGTGKSHTIANIISSLLARGKRVLVTSQTENALRVLRGFIPQEIRSLCVSHLGSDIESKKQLHEAVDSIGKNLADKNSTLIEKRISQLKKELREIRALQSRLRNQIRDWVEIESCKITIDGKSLTSLRAAKECAEKGVNHGWFRDEIQPEKEPPLNNEELIELCRLLKDISPGDRKSCQHHLPDPGHILSPEVLLEKVLESQSIKTLAAETEEERNEWGTNLSQASLDDIRKAIRVLEEATSEIQRIGSQWQLLILDLITTGIQQQSFWRDFLIKCANLRTIAWKDFNKIQNYNFDVGSIHRECDVMSALEELDRAIKKGRNPANWLARIILSKEAKLIFDSIRIDAYPISTHERVDAAKSFFSYKKNITKFATLWQQGIKNVNGPSLKFSSSMLLAEIDEKIRDLTLPLNWNDRFLEKIGHTLIKLGCKNEKFHNAEILKKFLKILSGEIAQRNFRSIDEELTGYEKELLTEGSKAEAHNLWKELANSIRQRSSSEYEEVFNELARIWKLKGKVQRLEQLASQIKRDVPIWYEDLEIRAMESGEDALEKDWREAWRWQRLNQWVKKIHTRESIESLQNRLEREKRKEKSLIVQLVKERTWQRQINKIEDYHYRALTAWANAMRLYGSGTGRYAHRYLAAATRAMVNAVGAVPAWIMPLHRAIQSFAAKPGIFDVIIVDEASQCDIRALSVLYRGKKILVVGDPEQISPTNVGIELEKVFRLLSQFLSDLPYPQTFHINNSLYEIAKAIPRMDRTLLTEHFRCVPEIIEFNNHLCPTYGGKLEPLRQPNPLEMLEPAISCYLVEEGFKNNNDVNAPEAEILVNKIIECCRDPRYSPERKKKTMGVISLLGEKQGKYIYDILSKKLEETEIAERRIICGDAYAFQGDERDVMFLSLVIATNAPFQSLTREADRQRFNVATSRARDQVFLFHSIKLEGIKNPDCVRYKLLSWYLNPRKAEIQYGLETLKEKAESEFELDIGKALISKGYKVIPQFRPLPSDFNYRIDLVIHGGKTPIAIECDGDRWHGPERWEYDQRRETQLRRAGWKFWRISGSAFYRDRHQTLEILFKYLEEQGVETVFQRAKNPNEKASDRDAGNKKNRLP